MFRRGISSVLVASVALAVIVSVAAIILYVSRSSTDMALELERQAMLQTVQSAQRALAAYNESALGMVRVLSHQRAVVEAFAGEPGRLDSYLKLYVSSNKNLWAAFIFNSQGLILSGYNARGESLAGQSRADRAYVKAALSGQGEFLGKEILAARSDGDVLVFSAAAAVKGDDGALLGGVAVFPRWESFTSGFIDPPRFGKRGYGYGIDAGGRIIAHATDKGMIFKNMSKEAFVQQALAQEVGQLEYDWKGERKLLSFVTDPETGFVLCMSAYQAELASTAGEQRVILLGIGAAATLFLVGFIALTLRRLVVRPIQDIEAFTRAIAKGDYTASLRSGFRFEFKSLSENVRTMVAGLKRELGFAQGVLKGFAQPCSVYDTDNRLTFTNAHMLRALDRDGAPEDFLGLSSGALVYNEPERVTSTVRSMRENRVIQHEIPFVSLKGNRKIFDITTTPITDLDGRIIGILAVWFELTEIRAQQERIREQNERIAQAAAAANTVSDQVASAAEELSAQIEQSSRGSEEQKSRTAEAATAMEEMNATVVEVAKSASAAAELADTAKAQAQDGAALVDEVVSTITRINEQAETLKADMTELGRQAEGIGKIMNVIADIADQTNLLALNAAIEAARAGDAGRGFAVVADEVRKLAEKTMNATNEVGGYIRSVQDSARKNIQGTEATTRAILASTETAHKSGESLRRIVAVVEQTADQVRGIATASEEQSAASEQIGRSAEEVNRIATETAEAMTQSAQAVSGLARLALDLKTIISEMHTEA